MTIRNSIVVVVAMLLCEAAYAAPDPLLVSQGRIDAIAELVGQRTADRTMERITTHYAFAGPGSWGYEWRSLGRRFEWRGDISARRGRAEKALEYYTTAQQVYRLGYLPENFRPEERRSWERFAAVQHKINGLLAVPFVEETIEVAGHDVTIQLYLPAPSDTLPGLVLYTGGVDGSKESGFDTGALFAAAGYATAAFDLMGTGELVDWPATPDSHSLHKAILDHYEVDPRFDASRMGVLGGSFGGYYAIQLAQEGVEPRLKGVINHCGLVSSLFENTPPEFVFRNFVLPTPDGDRPRSFIRRIGLDPDAFDYDELVAVFSAFSLTARGVVGQSEATLTTPILTVNGGRDSTLSPIADMQLVQDSAAVGELWTLGLSGHCASDFMPVARPDMVRWAQCAIEGIPIDQCTRN